LELGCPVGDSAAAEYTELRNLTGAERGEAAQRPEGRATKYEAICLLVLVVFELSMSLKAFKSLYGYVFHESQPSAC
jgi:hypothetical protein